MIDLSLLSSLPITNRITIPSDYLDEMGHMNIMYYIHIFDRAAWGLFELFGVTIKELESYGGGMFALKQFIQYLAEVHVGETVAVRSRVLGVSHRRIHFMHFMINETTGKLASTFEVLGSYADLNTRRTAPFPDSIAARIQDHLQHDQSLPWDAPICGILKP
ncbi:MAG: acyl-CoA thioesterase [Chloroflexota bacterium]